MRRASRSGMSLVEIVIVTGLLSVFAMVMGSVYSNLLRVQKNIDLKTESQSVGSALRLMLVSPQSCKKAFRITTAVISGPNGSIISSTQADPNFTPSWPASTFVDPLPSPPTPIALPRIQVMDQVIAPGVELGQFVVDSLSLTPRLKIIDGEYAGTIALVLRKKGTIQSVGSGVFVQSFPLTFKLMTDATSPNQLFLSDCWGSSELDPKATCDDMGGLWLDSTLPKTFMSKPRCNFGQEIFLAQNEAPDPVPLEGGAIQGQRVEECYYSSSNVVKTYLCPSRSANRAGNRCVFASAVNSSWPKRWEIRYFSGTSWSNSVKGICDKGVKVTVRNAMADQLEHNEPLWLAYGDENNVPSSDLEKFLYEQDRLKTVTRCKTRPDDEVYTNCSNPTNPASAKSGAANSCIFVRNVKLSLGTAQNSALNAFNNACSSPCVDIDKNNYTGWIYVRGPRVRSVRNLAAGQLPTIQEARGAPCYQVEVNLASFDQVTETRLTGPDATLFSQAESQVLECIHEGVGVESSEGVASLAVPGAPTRRFTMYSCDWSKGPIQGHPNDVLPGLNTLKQTLPFAGFLGNPADTSPAGLGNDVQQLTGELASGGCWYVGGAGARGVASGSSLDQDVDRSAAPPTNAPLNSFNIRLASYATGGPASCSAGQGVCPVNRYSAGEWVYFTGQMPVGTTIGNATAAGSWFYLNAYGDSKDDYGVRTRVRWSGGNGGATPSLPALPAIPCNRGIRIPKPAPSPSS